MRGIVTGAICIVMKVNYTPFHKSRTRTRHPVSASRLPTSTFDRDSRVRRAGTAPLPLQLARAYATRTFDFEIYFHKRCRTARSILSLSSSNFSRFEQVYKRGTKFPNPRDSARKLENLFPPLPSCCLNDYLAFVALDYDKFARRKMRRRFNLSRIDWFIRTGEGITFDDAFKFNDNIFLKRVTCYVTRENYRYIRKIFIEVRSDCTIRTKRSWTEIS